MGAPALLKEGVSWRDVRLRAMHARPSALATSHAGTRRSLKGQAPFGFDLPLGGGLTMRAWLVRGI